MLKKLFIIFLLSGVLAGRCFADGNDSNTVSLLHMDGADASTTFTDSACGGTHIWTAYNQAQIDTAQKEFGTASGLFDGTGDYIDTPDSADWSFGSGKFTIDFWVRFNATTDIQFLVFQTEGSNDWWGISTRIGLNLLTFYARTTAAYQIGIKIPFTPSVNTWYHIALVRNGTLSTDWYGFVNGEAQTLELDAGDWANAISEYAGSVYIGDKGAPNSFPLNGWMDEVRISKGIARWTSNFTPYTSAYSGTCGGGAAPSGQVILIE